MKTMNVTLQLSTDLHGRHRERCPTLLFTENNEEVATLRSDVAEPRLQMEDATYDRIRIADDAIARVLDEEAWLTEISRLLRVGGELIFTLPAAGPLAWLDALTIYRYIADVSGRGDDPDSTRPTGWNRHYAKRGLQLLLSTAGLDLKSLKRANHAAQEIGMLSSLVVHNWIRRDRRAELSAWEKFGRRKPNGSSNLPFGTTWVITAVKRAEPEEVNADPAAEFIDPAADQSE